jgi:hypothetical protein
MPNKRSLIFVALVLASWITPARAALWFSRTVLSNTTEGECFKTAADNGRKIFTQFKTSPIDSAGVLNDPKFAGIFVSVTCVGQGANAVMLVIGAGNDLNATKSVVQRVQTLMVLGFGPVPAGK